MLLHEYSSPCGTLLLGVGGGSLYLCDWAAKGRADKTLKRIRRELPSCDWQDDSAVMDMAVRQLDEYFSGMRRDFNLPLKPVGTEFQLKVWEALATIPYGDRMSYKTVADNILRPTAARAVAGAVGANALSILIPCHRVIASDGTSGGYAGGLDAKRFLLHLESQGSYFLHQKKIIVCENTRYRM